MPITKLPEIWEVISSDLPRDDWIPLHNIYQLVEKRLKLKTDDFLPSAPNSDEPKWMRNVRNVLQSRKTKGKIAWDRNGKYMIQSSDITIADDSIVVYEQSKPRYSISEERFKAIQRIREQVGLAGETWVTSYERTELNQNGRSDLASNVKRVSEVNLAAGYDVLSYEIQGTEKFIEVKTTALSKMEFFLSLNELDIAKEFKHHYWIYFVSEIYGNPNLIKIHDPVSQIGKFITLTPTNFRVQISV